MIISQTPLRVSFFGGGTDIQDYYKQHTGAVLSGTIDKYVYIIVKSRYDDLIVLNYSDRERVSGVDSIKHPIFREALKITGVDGGVEITSIADIPSEGSGLGSSSSFTVGLLNALYTYKGEYKNAHQLAELTCKIEIDILGEPIGKQDQYAAAYGGFKSYFFNPDDSVDVIPLNLSNRDFHMLNMNSMLFYTGITRRSSVALNDQKKNSIKNLDGLNMIKELAIEGVKYFNDLDIKKIGTLLDINWNEKKQLSDKIHSEEINRMYDLAKTAGIVGGKLLGAGGGGFFLFLCPPENQDSVRLALKGFKELPFAFERHGSKIILNINDNYGFI